MKEPFLSLLLALASDDLIANGDGFDSECIYSDGDYKYFADMFVRIANGAFPLEDCDDEIAMTDEGGTAKLRFTLDGKKYDWRAKVDNDWLDLGILERMGALACKRSTEARFVMIDHRQMIIVLCLTAAQVSMLREQTLLDFEILDRASQH